MSKVQAVSPVRVAALQFDPQVGLENKEKNLQTGLRLAGQAVRDGANLIVLPELSNTGYVFQNRQEAFAHGEEVPGGTCCSAWAAFAAEHACYVAVGLVERDGVRLYNSLALIGPDGLIGRYRKSHLWNQDKLWFTAGDLGFPVFDTPIGRIGLLICWDIWFPEVPRILAQQGADIICSANNWVWTPPPLFDEAGRCMASYLTMTASHVNALFIAAANRVGEERGARFLGCSLITGTNGWPIGQVAPAEGEAIVMADIDLCAARSALIWNDLNDLHRDRRTDLYDAMLGYGLHPQLPR